MNTLPSLKFVTTNQGYMCNKSYIVSDYMYLGSALKLHHFQTLDYNLHIINFAIINRIILMQSFRVIERSTLSS